MCFCSVFSVCENSAKMNKTIVIAGKYYPLESLNQSILYCRCNTILIREWKKKLSNMIEIMLKL